MEKQHTPFIHLLKAELETVRNNPKKSPTRGRVSFTEEMQFLQKLISKKDDCKKLHTAFTCRLIPKWTINLTIVHFLIGFNGLIIKQAMKKLRLRMFSTNRRNVHQLSTYSLKNLLLPSYALYPHDFSFYSSGLSDKIVLRCRCISAMCVRLKFILPNHLPAFFPSFCCF